MLCLVSLLHDRMVEGQIPVLRQMALLLLVEYWQRAVFWAPNSQMEGFVGFNFIYDVSCVIASS